MGSPGLQRARQKMAAAGVDEVAIAPAASIPGTVRSKLIATTAQIIIPNGERLGNKVIEVVGLKKHMGDKLLIAGGQNPLDEEELDLRASAHAAAPRPATAQVVVTDPPIDALAAKMKPVEDGAIKRMPPTVKNTA